jgi:NAD/NADP transhydrogenase beta subunit
MPRLVPALRSICTIAACSVGLASHVRADDIISHEVGGANLRLIDLSAILNVSVGASTGTAEELGWSQSGSHDPTRTGFDFNWDTATCPVT